MHTYTAAPLIVHTNTHNPLYRCGVVDMRGNMLLEVDGALGWVTVGLRLQRFGDGLPGLGEHGNLRLGGSLPHPDIFH